MDLATLVLRSNTGPTRFTLGVGAALWALSLWYPGNTFERGAYEYMRYAATEPMWAGAWSAYSFLTLLHLFKTDCHQYWGIFIDSFGLVLWSFSSIAILMNIGFPPSAAISPSIALTFAAFWVLIRSHITGCDRRRGG